MLNVDHRTICRFPDMHDRGFMQVLDCLDDIRKILVTARKQQHGPYNGGPAGATQLTFLRGGNATGGSATSTSSDYEAEGGSVAGGNVEVLSPSYTGQVPLVGGDGTGGSAIGIRAVGGDAVGGSVRWS